MSYLRNIPADTTVLNLHGLRVENLSIGDILHIKGLRTLRIEGRIAEVGRIVDFRGLRNLAVIGPLVSDLNLLAELPGLEALQLSGGKLDLGPLANLRKLESLTLGRLHTSTDFSVLSELTALKYLEIYWQAKLVTFPDLSRLTRLERFEGSILNGLVDATGLAGAPNLKMVRLAGAPKLDDGSRAALAGHPKVAEIHIYPKGPSTSMEQIFAAEQAEGRRWKA